MMDYNKKMIGICFDFTKKTDPKICGPKLVPCIFLGAWCDSIVRSWQYPLQIVAQQKNTRIIPHVSIYYIHINI